MIQITADTRRAVVTNKELLTVGSAGIQVQFTLSEDWNTLSKLAVFRVGDDGTKVDVALGESLTCVVPPEVLTQEDEVLFIGIYGANGQGTVIIPTVWASAGVVKPGTEPETPASAQPTPEIWAQILGVAQDAERTADEAYTLAENAQGYADAASNSAAAANAAATRASSAANQANNARNSAQSSASQASASASQAANSASQASTSASTASNAAVAANTDAQNAAASETAAEQAQAAAEDAAQSIEESAAQIAQNTQDISDVKNAIDALGDYEVVDTISDLLTSSKDVVFVKNNNGVWGSGISCIYEKHNDWTFGGYIRNNGDRMYPRISGAAPVKHFNAHNWIDVALTWFGRENLVHDDNNHNGLFAENCVPVDGKYDFDCSEFVGSVLLGITYDNSRYVGGTDSANHNLNYIGVTSFPPSNSSDRVNGGLLANEMARFFAEQGLLYAISQNLTQEVLQPGDVLFFKNPSTAPTFYQNINHVAIVVDTVKDNVIIAESSGNHENYGYGTTPIITRKINVSNVRSACIAFARPNYHATASNQSIRGYLKTGRLTGLMLIGTGIRISASDGNLTQGEVNSQEHLRMAATKAFIPVSVGEKIVYTGTPSFGRGSMFCRVVEYDKDYKYLGNNNICTEGNAGSRVIPAGTAYIRFWTGFSNQDSVLTIPDIDNNVRVSIGDVTTELSALSNAISQKQDATNYVTLSGTIVTQTGADNTMYLCGELAELTFTAPATGQTAIRFTSGTTPTVATFANVTWLNGFDPSAIEASKTYEVNILNGLGVAAWT